MGRVSFPGAGEGSFGTDLVPMEEAKVPGVLRRAKTGRRGRN